MEIVKRQGYIPPRPMASMLQAIIDDPTPGPSVLPEEADRSCKQRILVRRERAGTSSTSSRRLRSEESRLGNRPQIPGLESRRILHVGCTARDGNDDAFERMARETLGAQRKLMDPVWGGVYQYSTDGDWKHPHYEKLLQFQAENLRIYAAAYARWGDPEYLEGRHSNPPAT